MGFKVFRIFLEKFNTGIKIAEFYAPFKSDETVGKKSLKNVTDNKSVEKMTFFHFYYNLSKLQLQCFQLIRNSHQMLRVWFLYCLFQQKSI